MIRLTLIDDGASIWIAPWHVVQIFSNGKGGSTIHLVGQIQTHVKEPPESVALTVSARGRPK